MRTIKPLISAVVMCAAFSVAMNAFACGESLFRVGKGVKYRAYSAPLPANVLVYVTSEEDKAMAEQLAQSGHGVYVVDDATALAAELGKGGYDVVIAPFSQRSTIESQDSPSDAAFLPVTKGEDEEVQVKGLYDRSLGSDDDIKRYLKAIHKTLKSSA